MTYYTIYTGLYIKTPESDAIKVKTIESDVIKDTFRITKKHIGEKPKNLINLKSNKNVRESDCDIIE